MWVNDSYLPSNTNVMSHLIIARLVSATCRKRCGAHSKAFDHSPTCLFTIKTLTLANRKVLHQINRSCCSCSHSAVRLVQRACYDDCKYRQLKSNDVLCGASTGNVTWLTWHCCARKFHRNAILTDKVDKGPSKPLQKVQLAQDLLRTQFRDSGY